MHVFWGWFLLVTSGTSKMKANSALSLWLSMVALTWPYLESGAVVQGGVEVPSKDLRAQRPDIF